MGKIEDKVLEDEFSGEVVAVISRGCLTAYRLGYVDDRFPKFKTKKPTEEKKEELKKNYKE